MATTETALAATISANAGGRRLAGELRRERQRFGIYLNGVLIGRAGSLGAAAHRLKDSLARDLPRHLPGDWGVEAHCATSPGIGLLFGNCQSGHGAGGPAHPCVAEIVNDYRRGDDSLRRALEFAARLLARCCSE